MFLRVLALVVLLSGATATPVLGQPSPMEVEAPGTDVFHDLDAETIALVDLQEPLTQPRAQPRSRSRTLRTVGTVTAAPAMMGDFFGGGIPFSTAPLSDPFSGFIPLGSNRIKIAENGKAQPMDGAFFNYNHYSNAMSYEDDTTGSTVLVTIPVDRYTFGVEKTFAEGLWSAELRVSFNSDLSRSPLGFGGFSIEGGDVCKLAANLKKSVYRSADTSLVVGLGMAAPAGNDVNFVDDTHLIDVHQILRNETVHLLPYIGFLRTPSERLFYQAFLQADFGLNGNRVIDVKNGGVVVDRLNEANLLFLDFQVGYWIYQSS